MDSLGSKIKGAIVSFISLALSLDGLACFLFYAFFNISSLIPCLLVAAYFLFEAVGRIYGLSFTMANQNTEGQKRIKAKTQLSFTFGIIETIHPLPWLFAVIAIPSLSSVSISAFPLIILLFKTSCELALSFVRFLPHRKKEITLAFDSLCSFCICLSLFISILMAYLTMHGKVEASTATTASNICFIILFFIQNIFFSLLFLEGGAIGHIKRMVSFGVRHGIGNYIVVSSSFMTVIISTISAIQNNSFAYAGIAVIYMALAATRLSALLWKNAIHRNVFNTRLAEARENKILLYVGCILVGFSFLFALGIVWLSKQKLSGGISVALIFQAAYGLFRLALCIRDYIKYQKQNQPFSIAVSSLDLLIGVYSLFSVFLIINSYYSFPWTGTLIDIISWLTFGGTIALGVIMIVLGINGYSSSKKLSEELAANSEKLWTLLRKHNISLEERRKEDFASLNKDHEFLSLKIEAQRIGTSSQKEEMLFNCGEEESSINQQSETKEV